MRRRTLVLVLSLVVAGLAASAQADPAKVQEGASPAPEDVASWEVRLTAAQTEIASARGRLARSEQALAEARHRKYPRGEALQALVKAVDDGRRDVRLAEARLPELIDQARRAGIEPGVLRRFEPEP